MALTSLQVSTVCGGVWSSNSKIKRCKYLSSIYNKKGKYVHLCTKKASSQYAKLKLTRAKADTNEKVLGDNCPGYLYLLHAKQGYDVPNSI